MKNSEILSVVSNYFKDFVNPSLQKEGFKEFSLNIGMPVEPMQSNNCYVDIMNMSNNNYDITKDIEIRIALDATYEQDTAIKIVDILYESFVDNNIKIPILDWTLDKYDKVHGEPIVIVIMIITSWPVTQGTRI